MCSEGRKEGYKKVGKNTWKIVHKVPLGIMMRLITEYRDVKGILKHIKKLAKLRGKQTYFTQKLRNLETRYRKTS